MNTYRLFIGLMAGFLGLPNIAAANPPGQSELIGVEYRQIWQDGGEQGQRRLVFWRRAQEVALEYPGKGITDIWHRNAKGALHLRRVFDQARRSIEYYGAELAGQNWAELEKLIAPALLEQLSPCQPRGDSQDACYEGRYAEQDYRIDWSETLQLPLRFQRQSADQQERWTVLRRIDDEQTIHAAFDQRQSYPSTDYADIGDNESDPFLLKMMNLGFIQHGSSGFYDADGHALQGSHGHHH